VVGFDSEHVIAGLEMKPVRHVLGQGRTDGSAGSSASDFLGHLDVLIER
jgi:hypothetical protein